MFIVVFNAFVNWKVLATKALGDGSWYGAICKGHEMLDLHLRIGVEMEMVGFSV